MRRSFFDFVVAVALSAAIGCGGTTGSGLVAFGAAAAGPGDAPGGGLPSPAWAFDTRRGFQVVLTRAVLHVGALYLNASPPISGAQETSCILPGVYVAEVTKGRDIDLLDSTPQPFPGGGEGKTDPATVGEVWLMGTADVNAQQDQTPILIIAGTATKGGVTHAFAGTLTIGKNRDKAPPNAATPGAHPLCKERIVTPIRIDVLPRAGGTLLMRADPRELLASVNFDDPTFLMKDAVASDPTQVLFDDDASTTAGLNLYLGLRAASTYTFEWVDGGP
jgi:hypothetical protein